MGALDRWDRHNQRVMDLARLRDPAAWTIPAILAVMWFAMAVASWILPWTPAVAVAWMAIAASAVVALRRAWRRRRALTEQADAAHDRTPEAPRPTRPTRPRPSANPR